MGGSNSRQSSKRGSKRRREEQEQHTGKQEVPPTEYNENVSSTLYSEDSRHKGIYRSNHSDFNMSRINIPEKHSAIAHSDGLSFCSENTPHRLNPIDYEPREFRREFQNGQGTQEFTSSRIRSNSLTDVNSDRDYSFEGKFLENRYERYSSANLSNQNYPVDRKCMQNYSTNDFRFSADSEETRSNLCDDVLLWDSDLTVDYGESSAFDCCVEPLVKRRQSDDSPSFCSLSGDRSENERSHSSQSHYSNSSNITAESESNIDTFLSGSPLNDALDILSFPSEWSSCSVDKIGYTNISLSSPEGNSIQRFFQRSCNSKKGFYLSINGIVRIENPFLHTLYLLKKEEMAMRNGHVDELFLFHGTKRKFVSRICEDNLDWRLFSEMHRFGKGVSFSPSAIYSSHYCDDKDSGKTVLLFKVLTSKCVIGSEDMDIPPNSNVVSFDTSIKEDASVIVKYTDNEFYPLYKIVCTKLYRAVS